MKKTTDVNTDIRNGLDDIELLLGCYQVYKQVYKSIMMARESDKSVYHKPELKRLSIQDIECNEKNIKIDVRVEEFCSDIYCENFRIELDFQNP